MTINEFFEKLSKGATWSAGVSFKRANNLPLDLYSVFASKTALDAYVAENPVAYPGQIVAVVSESEDAVYFIDHDMKAKPIGANLLVDGNSIAKGDNNTLTLVGFAEAPEGAQPFKNAEGKIEWVVPSIDTIPGLRTLIGDVEENKTLVQMIGEAEANAVITILGEAGIDEKYDTLKEIADYILSDTTSSADLIKRVENLEEVGAEKNFIASVEASQFSVDENRKLSLAGVQQEKITGLTNKAGNADTLANLLDSKVDKNGTDRLITEEEAKKLAALVVGDGGAVEISGKVNAENVVGLDTLLNGKVDKVDGMGLSANNFTNEHLSKLTNIEDGAQANVIEIVKIAGANAPVSDTDKSINIPIAAKTAFGVVMGSDAENKVSIGEDGTMSVNSLDVNRLVQDEETILILNGGSSSR